MASVKQVSPASCKTRDSNLIVNGVGSIPANLMGIVGVEHGNFINPDLCWKTIPKGCRSGRSRKMAAKGSTLNSDRAAKYPRLISDTKISESEKLGVAVLGQHFSEKIEHVPIKKRRFMVRSPSPPHLEDNEQCIYYRQASRKRHSCPKLVLRKQHTLTGTFEVTGSHLVSGELLEGMNSKLSYNEDFSGIEILADVACNNILVGDAIGEEEKAVVEKLTGEGSDRSTIAIPMEETTTSVETANSSTKDMVYDNRKEDSSSHDDLYENIRTDKDRSIKCSVSSRDVRLHWDLNVAMEAWEQPCEIAIVDPQTNSGEVITMDCKQQSEEVNEIHKESINYKHGLPTEVQFIVNNEEHNLEVCSGIDKFNHECGPTNNVLKASTNVAVDANALFPGFNNISEKLVVEEDGASAHNIPVKQITEVDEVENSENAFPCALISERTASVVKESGEDSNIASGLQDDFELPQRSSICGCDPAVQVEVRSVAKAEENCEDDVSFSGASAGEGQPVVSVDAKEQVDKASLATSQEYSNDSANRLGKVTIGDHNNDSYYWDNHHNTDHLVGKGNTRELQAGYDSQYEDGELREIDMEIDYVDNESDECVTINVVALGSSLSGRAEMSSKYKEERLCEVDAKNIEDNMKLEKRGLGPGFDDATEKIEHLAAGGTLRESPVGSKTKLAASAKTSQVADGVTIRRHTADCALLVDDKDSHTKEVGSIELELSCDGESLSSASPNRNDDMLEQMNRSGNSKLYSQEEKEVMGRERCDLGYWDSETHELPTYHGSSGSERPRPRSVIESRGCSVASEQKMLDNPSRQSGKNSFSSCVYRPLKRRSPANMNYAYNGHRGMMVPARDVSPDRRRFRRNQPGDRRIREEYCRTRAEDTANEYCMPQRKRKQSFSPGRGLLNNFAQSYSKSYSNSRSHSPFPRELNDRSSRSPDHRFVGRIERARFPFLKPSFAEDEEIRFVPFPRHRFSPQRNSRWTGDPNSDADRFRSRRLPFKMFRQGQRFDSAHSHRRSDSHDNFEPVIHPGRFLETNRSYEGSDDVRGNLGGRFNIPRVRHFNGGDLEQRFRYDEEDSFVLYNSRTYDDLNRIADRRPREVSRIRRANEEGYFRYNHDRIFNSSPKSFEMQDP